MSTTSQALVAALVREAEAAHWGYVRPDHIPNRLRTAGATPSPVAPRALRHDVGEGWGRGDAVQIVASTPIFLLDANVLFSVPKADVFLALAAAGLVSLCWSDQIHDEWTRNVLRKRAALDPAVVNRRRAMIDAAFPDARVEPDPATIDTLCLPDPDDRHVLAAAIAGRATHIVTSNLGDFPSRVLAKHGLTAQSPDTVLLDLLRTHPAHVIAAIETILYALSPTIDRDAYLEILRRTDLSRFAKAYRP